MVLKETIEILAEYLLHIFWAVFTLNTYSNKWHEWDTIVLHKPGKPHYNVLKAYRLIALMNTLCKLLSMIMVEDIVYMCEWHALLPNHHFGGRPGHCTMDAMHVLAH